MEQTHTATTPTLSEDQHTPVKWEVPPQTNEELTQLLKENPLLYSGFRNLDKDWRQRFQDFCLGKTVCWTAPHCLSWIFWGNWKTAPWSI